VKILKIITENFDHIKPFLNGSAEFVSEEKGIINLIVGWDLAKENGASILKHKINDNTYWTFLPNEKRKIFEQHLLEFKQLAIDKLKSSKKIININPLEFNHKEALIEYIKSEFRDKLGYLFKDKLYIYNGNEIYHLDIGLLYFMSWDIMEQIKKIIRINNFKKEDLKYEKYFEHKYIPYLINAEEDITISNIRQS
jgi:hypothetical protein